MPDGTIRLLTSLRQFVGASDSWLSRGPWFSGQRTVFDQALEERADCLRQAFPFADPVSIAALTGLCSIVSVPGGAPLVMQGDQPEAIYVVVTGACGGRAPERFGPGAVIGDAEFITSAVRATTIKALRTSELLRISTRDLRIAAMRCPGVLLAISSGVVHRLQAGQPASVAPVRPGTFCVVPIDGSIDVASILQQIAGSLKAFGSVEIVSAEQAAGQTSSWFAEIERRVDFVLFQAECFATAWTRFCLRQCERVVLLVHGDTDPADCEAFGPDRLYMPRDTPLSLMLLWQAGIVPNRTGAWLAVTQPEGHHHIRSLPDIERASRLIAGRGLGLVLSGGGARALAHIGVIEALTTNGVQIDAIGGTSIGAVVAAVFAMESDLAATVLSLATGFAKRRFSDFAIPRTALYSERAFARTLGHCFGEIAIEDLPIPMFCVSTNLTEGVSVVHRTGRLVTWLRASSAVPGICPPILEQNNVYIDGGVLNNVPTDGIRGFGVASAISVDVGSSLKQARSDGGEVLPNMLDLLWRVGTIASDAAAKRGWQDGDVVLRPEVGNMGLFDWDAHERAIAAGHQVAVEHLAEIEAALGRVR